MNWWMRGWKADAATAPQSGIIPLTPIVLKRWSIETSWGRREAMRGSSEIFSRAMDAYNYRRWIAWLVALCSLLWGSYDLGNLPGLFVGLGIYALAIAVSQEIRAAIFPIGMAAIDELDRKMQSPQSN